MYSERFLALLLGCIESGMQCENWKELLSRAALHFWTAKLPSGWLNFTPMAHGNTDLRVCVFEVWHQRKLLRYPCSMLWWLYSITCAICEHPHTKGPYNTYNTVATSAVCAWYMYMCVLVCMTCTKSRSPITGWGK